MKRKPDPAEITYPGFHARRAGFRIWHEGGVGWGFSHPDGWDDPPPYPSYEAAARAADAEALKHA